MKRQLKLAAKRVLMNVHEVGLRMGVVILPKHYYVPVTDVLELRRTRSTWARRSSMTGIETDVARQAAVLTGMVAPFEPEYRGNTALLEAQENGFGPGFGYIEAQCLHGVLRSLKPRRILEVGSGVSTYCALKAVGLNAAEGRPPAITCVEPYPSPYLRAASGIELIERKAQDVPVSQFEALGAGDFLFIDSSHTVRPGGDVLYLYLEVLPRLRSGVVVHIHDIYFPYLYQRDLLHTVRQWSETALLQALLTNNPRMEILFCLSMLHYDAPGSLKQVFPEYLRAGDADGLAEPGERGHFPASIYLRIV